jgi:hypothetical protein
MKNLSKTILAVLATGLLSCGLFCQQAHAVTGSVTFNGNFSTNDNSNFNLATKFTSFTGVTVSGVPAPTGDYAGSTGASATFLPFTFRPSLSPSPVVNEWTFTNSGNVFTFDLESLDPVLSSKIFLSLSGMGTLKENGGNASSGLWTFSGNNNRGTLSFTSTSTAVPDGGSAVALLGIALAGIEIVRRKIKAA